MSTLSDDRLVALAQATGDRGAFNDLFARYESKLRGFLLGRIEESHVDDVIQEAYLKAFINIRGFAGKSAFATWLFSIAINECRQQQRRAGIYQRFTELLSQRVTEPESGGALDLVIDFQNLSRQLSPVQYDVFLLSHVYGYSHREIAKTQGIPLGSVKSYLAQAKARMRSREDP